MTVGYSRTLGVTFLALGAIVVLLNLMIPSGAAFIRLFPGLVVMVVGGLYLARPFFEYTEDAITVFAPLGPVTKVYPIGSPLLVRVDEKQRIWVRVDGREKKVGASRWMADNAQFDAVVAAIRQARAEAEAAEAAEAEAVETTGAAPDGDFPDESPSAK